MNNLDTKPVVSMCLRIDTSIDQWYIDAMTLTGKAILRPISHKWAFAIQDKMTFGTTSLVRRMTGTK